MSDYNHEQQINQLPNSERFNYIIALSDENIRLSLLRFLNDDDDKIKIINTFSSDKTKLEALSQLEYGNMVVHL